MTSGRINKKDRSKSRFFYAPLPDNTVPFSEPNKTTHNFNFLSPEKKRSTQKKWQKTILRKESRVTATEAKNCEYYLILRKSHTITEWQKTERTIRVTIGQAKNYYTQKNTHGRDMAKNCHQHIGFARDVRFNKNFNIILASEIFIFE